MTDRPRIWLTEWEAAKHVDRSRYTIRDWRVRGFVQARKRKNLWEFDRDSLDHVKSLMAFKYQERLVIHWAREEAFEYLFECLRQRIPFPNDSGLARMMQVTQPQARAWRSQWLKALKSDLWLRSDEEIAVRVNTTVSAVAQARAIYETSLRNRFR